MPEYELDDFDYIIAALAHAMASDLGMDDLKITLSLFDEAEGVELTGPAFDAGVWAAIDLRELCAKQPNSHSAIQAEIDKNTN